jgi:hypothetical protein
VANPFRAARAPSLRVGQDLSLSAAPRGGFPGQLEARRAWAPRRGASNKGRGALPSRASCQWQLQVQVALRVACSVAQARRTVTPATLPPGARPAGEGQGASPRPEATDFERPGAAARAAREPLAAPTRRDLRVAGEHAGEVLALSCTLPKLRLGRCAQRPARQRESAIMINRTRLVTVLGFGRIISNFKLKPGIALAARRPCQRPDLAHGTSTHAGRRPLSLGQAPFYGRIHSEGTGTRAPGALQRGHGSGEAQCTGRLAPTRSFHLRSWGNPG